MKKTQEQMIEEMHEKIIRWDERLFGKLGLESRQGLVEIAVLIVILFLTATYGTKFLIFLR